MFKFVQMFLIQLKIIIQDNIGGVKMSYKLQHKVTKNSIAIFDEIDDELINQLIKNNGAKPNDYEVVEFVPETATAEQQRQQILKQLEQLDKHLTRTEENIISHLIDTSNYQPYQREIDIANQKQALRQQLQELGVQTVANVFQPLTQEQINFNRLPAQTQEKAINDTFMNTGVVGKNAFELAADRKAQLANTQKVVQLQDAAKQAAVAPPPAPPANTNNQVTGGIAVASTTARPATYDPTNDINTQSSAREAAAIAAFERKKAAALAALEEERQKIDPYYSSAKEGVSVKSQQVSRNLAEYLAATGRINSGANEQRALSRDVALQGNLGSLESQRVSAQQAIDRQKALAQTTAEADLEALRQNIYADKMLQEIQAKQQAANQQISQYNADRAYGLQDRQLGAELTGYDPVTGKPTFANTQAIRNFGLAEGGLTGNYNGGRTIQGQQLDFNKGVTEAGLTGNYNGNRTIQGQELDMNRDNTKFNQGIATAGITGDYNGQRTLQGQQVDSTLATNKLQQEGLRIENVINQFKIDNILPQEAERARQLIRIGEAELAAKIFENTNAPEAFKMKMKEMAASINAQNASAANSYAQAEKARKSPKEDEPFTPEQKNQYYSEAYAAIKALSVPDAEKALNYKRQEIETKIGHDAYVKLYNDVLAAAGKKYNEFN